jgi:hypothetical protein
LVKMKDGKAEDWKRLDKVWALVGDKPAFIEYVRGEIARMLPSENKAEAQSPKAAIPVPNADSTPVKKTPAIPIP